MISLVSRPERTCTKRMPALQTSRPKCEVAELVACNFKVKQRKNIIEEIKILQALGRGGFREATRVASSQSRGFEGHRTGKRDSNRPPSPGKRKLINSNRTSEIKADLHGKDLRGDGAVDETGLVEDLHRAQGRDNGRDRS
jgi:hypothetical protein